MKTLPSILLALSFASPLVAQDDDFTGTTLFGSAYRMNSITGDVSPLMSTGFPNPFGMTTDGAGTYWAIANVRDLLVVDPRTGYSEYLVTIPTSTGRGLEYLGGSSLYVLVDGGFGNDDRLYTYDIASDTTTLIGNSDHERLEGIARSPITGTLYVWDMAEGLCEMNPATGATVDVNPGVGGSFEIQALAFHPVTGELYGGGEGIYSIDVATGAHALIGAGLPGMSVRGMAYHDYTPSACLLLETTPLVAGAGATLTVSGPADGEQVAILYSFSGGETSIALGGYCATLGLGNLTPANLLGQGVVAAGDYQLAVNVPAAAQGLLVFLQAMQRNTCPGECVSNILAEVIQ